MAFFRKAVLASTMIAAGLASTTGAALADDHEGGEKNFVNAQGTDVLNQPSACDINADVLNVLPIDEVDAALDIPVLNKTGDGNEQADVPNGENTCNPESTQGAVDSNGGDTADATENGTAARD